MTFQVPTQTFTRKMKDGTIGTVKRRVYAAQCAGRCVAVSPEGAGGGGGAASVYAEISAGGG